MNVNRKVKYSHRRPNTLIKTYYAEEQFVMAKAYDLSLLSFAKLVDSFFFYSPLGISLGKDDGFELG